MEDEEEDQDQTQLYNILDKWFALQQIIKEGITLNEIIENQKKENKNLLKTKYYDYFQSKLINREVMEKSITIDSHKSKVSPSSETNLNSNKALNKPPKYISFELIRKETESILGDAYIAVEKLFDILRNDFQFIVKIASLTEQELSDTDINPNSIVDLFCHQFYENLLIPNPEHEELLILCSLLLEQEIRSMTTMSISSFIDEHSTFLGKFLKSYTKKPELKSYLSITLGSIILKVENSGEFFMNLDPMKIMKSNASWENNSKELLYANLEQQNRTTSDFSEANTDTSIYYQEYNKVKDQEREESNFLFPILMKHKNYSEDPNKIKEFVEKITEDDLIQRIIDEKDENIKEFYKRQIERFGKDKDLYTCSPFLTSLELFRNSKEKILLRYVKNYEIIKCLIDNILQSLLSSVTTIPYSLRCICKIICLLIHKRFPNISTYERNAFIGEFIFGKCILPILVDCDHNGVITSSILSSSIRDCLKIAAKVLIKVSRGLLFDSSIDMNLTIFNHYIIQIIPEMNRFCNQLIKVKLPCVVNDLITGKVEYSSMSKYQYFDQNREELINLQCVCFSIEDILAIIEYIQPALDTVFKPPNNLKTKESLFFRTMQKLINQKDYLKKTFKNSQKKQFFILFQEEENPYKEELLKLSQEKFTFFTNQDTSNLILSKIKYCIVVILQELNLINNKVYSYLNQANSNLNFFKAINQTLQIEEYAIDTENDKIPLNWYSLYMISNLSKLDDKYKGDDFSSLYDELYEEECKMINLLKLKSNLLITKYGMNIRCAETLNQKAKVDLLRGEKILKIIKTKKLIENEGIEVCVTSKNPRIDDNSPIGGGNNANFTPNVVVLHNKKKKGVENNKDIIINNSNSNVSIAITTVDQCIHNISNDTNAANKNRRQTIMTQSYPNHTKSIKEFIKLFVGFREVKEDVYQGKQIHNIAKSLNNYLMLIQKKIVNEPLFQNIEEINYITEKIKKVTEGEKRNPLAKEEVDKLQKELNQCNEIVKKEIDEIIEKVRHYITLKLYIRIYPENPLVQDIEFYNKVRLISWITPEHLEIKKVFQNEKLWELAMKSINKMDAGRTPQEKLNCISNAYGIINRSIKFCSGKEKDSGAEELTPIFQFILIKAQPRRLFSNIHYIKGICDPSNVDDPLKGPREFFLGQVEAAVLFITEINHTCLKISKESYDKNMEAKAAEYKFTLQQSSSGGSMEMSSSFPNSQSKTFLG